MTEREASDEAIIDVTADYNVSSLFSIGRTATHIASDVVKVEGEDPTIPGDYPRSFDTKTPRDRNDSPISG